MFFFNKICHHYHCHSHADHDHPGKCYSPDCNRRFKPGPGPGMDQVSSIFTHSSSSSLSSYSLYKKTLYACTYSQHYLHWSVYCLHLCIHGYNHCHTIIITTIIITITIEMRGFCPFYMIQTNVETNTISVSFDVWSPWLDWRLQSNCPKRTLALISFFPGNISVNKKLNKEWQSRSESLWCAATRHQEQFKC